MSKQSRLLGLALFLSTASVWFSCGGATSAPISGLATLQGVSVSISPSSMTIATSTVEQFTATVNGSGVQTVQWQVNGLPGGAPIIGTIDTNGNYTAPQFVPNPPHVVITAIANADNTKSGNASVTITGALIPAQVFMSPSPNAYVQKGTQLNLGGGVIGPSDTTVIWQVNGVANGNTTVGTIKPGANNTAVYTAPKNVPNPPTVTIKAISHAESDRFASCAVTIFSGPPSIATVTVTPVVALVQAQNPFTFTATVVGPSDPSVSWRVNGLTGGSAVDGTIASVNTDKGLYYAPATVPVDGSLVQVTAVSNAQPNRTSSADVNISPPPANGVTIVIDKGASEVEVGAPAQFHATVGNAATQTVTWQVNGITGGNSTYGTITPDTDTPNQGNYTAPAKVPAQKAIVVGAVPAAAPTIAATFPVTITPTPPPTLAIACDPVACLPGSLQLPVNWPQQFNLLTTLSNPNASWYVCVGNVNGNCVLGGNSTVGTISPDTESPAVTYTTPAAIPNPSVVIIKAVPDEAPNSAATQNVVISTHPSVQVSPPGPFKNVQTGTSAGPFSSYVFGSLDQTVTWNVNGIPGGNSTIGTVNPDGGNPNDEDYLAPNSVPNPATVGVTAVAEADPTAVSNVMNITVVAAMNNPTVTISPQQPPPVTFGGQQTFTALVDNFSSQVVDWTLSPASPPGAVCTDPNLPTPCGKITPAQTDNQPATYTAPTTPGLPDPYYVNITATIDQDKSVFDTVKQEISNNAPGSITINPATLTVPLSSLNETPISVIFNNIPDPAGQNVSWNMSCNTQAPNSTENCGPAFGKGDGSGPGCLTIPGFVLKPCDETSFGLTGNQSFQYQPPSLLGNPPDYEPQETPNCTSQAPPGSAVVEIDALVNASNCPGPPGQQQCTATLCIQITP